VAGVVIHTIGTVESITWFRPTVIDVGFAVSSGKACLTGTADEEKRQIRA
jgi:hypothetical protein